MDNPVIIEPQCSKNIYLNSDGSAEIAQMPITLEVMQYTGSGKASDRDIKIFVPVDC